MTSGISNDVPLELSIFLWCLIDELKGKVDLDYLQVFKLESKPHKQGYMVTVTHSQEVPEYSKKHEIFLDKPIEGKIFVIDDKTHSTMLWSSEY
jgi:hypothetical protein